MEFELDGEYAWDTAVWKDRGNRPKVSINSVSTKKHRLANDLRDLNPEIQVIPKKDEFEKHAELRNTLIKDIQDRSCAESIYDSAFCQGLSAGFSFMRVSTEYASPTTFEQQISIKNIPNNLGVHYDFTHKNPAYIDMKWGSIEGQFSQEEYRKKFPNATSELNFPTDAFQDDNSQPKIITNEFYRIKEIPKKLLQISNGQGGILEGFSDDLKISEALEYTIDGEQVWQVIQERDSFKPQLEWYLMNGADILDERKDMLGSYIPIIPYETRSLFIRGKKYIVSFIRNLKEPARLKNYAKSLEVEQVALQPLNTIMAPYAAVSDYMEYYKTANNQRWPVLPYNHVDKAGNPIPAPIRDNYQGPSNQLAGTFQTYDKDLNDVSGMYDENIGSPSQLRSGVAIDLKQSQGNHNNYDYIDNFITRTLTYEGIVLNDLITQVHDTETEIQVDRNGSKETIPINVEGGIDLTEGEFEVKAVVGSASESEREKSNDMLLQLMERVPAMQNAAHIIANNMDNLKDKEDLVKILKASLPPNVLSMLEQDEQAVFVENQQLKQQLEGISAEYEQAMDLIKSMQIDYKKAMDVQSLKSQTDLEKVGIQSATTLSKTEMEQQGKMMQDMFKGFQDLKQQIAGLTANNTDNSGGVQQ